MSDRDDGPLRVAIVGASGRMGQSLIQSLSVSDDLMLGAALVRPGADDVGSAVVGSTVAYRDDLANALVGVDVVVDFATPKGLKSRAGAIAAAGVPWLLGTTGLDENEQACVVNAARQVPVLFSANTSLAVNGMMASLTSLAGVLGASYDVDIIDVHHRTKTDAPSGTALELGRAVAAGWRAELEDVRSRDEQDGERSRPSIRFAAVRAGSHPGEHRVIFSGADDSIEVVHRVNEHGVFARGALLAAHWLARQNTGLYDMADFIASVHGHHDR
ncbi:MAG: 4-hydroxy-tetrahydrodipicolinate reductase [Pseudomonadota bacterium]